MTSIANSRIPKHTNRVTIAKFNLSLVRDGEKLVLEAEPPKTFGTFASLTGAEKDAYHNIIDLVINKGIYAMRKAEEDAARRVHKTRKAHTNEAEV